MFLHTAHTEGLHRVAQYRSEADLHRALSDARLGSPLRRTVVRALRSAAAAMARIADRLAAQHPAHPAHPAPARRRSPAANA